jgi:putative heme iron utilization protein
MDESLKELRDLVTSRPIAALGTLHEGAPYVSMVPYALLEDGSTFLIHVSELSAHTRDMLGDPRVSLMITARDTEATLPQELARLTIQGEARRLEEPSPEYDLGKSTYLKRFPDSSPMFDFADFSLFAITPTSLRWIGGFAAAQTLPPEALAQALRGPK